MTKIIKHIIGRIVFLLGLHRVLLGNRALVIAFHSINDVDIDSSYNCRVEDFKKYCLFLDRHFSVIDMDELLLDLDKGDLSGKAVITFDDGYKDNQTNALPMLISRSLPATIFVVTNEMDCDRGDVNRSRLSGKGEWLNWDDVKEIQMSRMMIGCHTMSHANLGNVDVDVARNELTGSRQAVLENSSSPATHFAYPYGGPFNMNAEVRKEVIASGFHSCATCYGGLVQPATDRFEIPREPVSTWYYSPYHFGFELIMRKLRGISGLPDVETRNWGL